MCYYVMFNPAQTTLLVVGRRVYRKMQKLRSIYVLLCHVQPSSNHFIASWQEGLQEDAEGKVHVGVIMSCTTQLKPLYW